MDVRGVTPGSSTPDDADDNDIPESDTESEIWVGGRAARRADGSVIPRPVHVPGLGRGYIRPLRYSHLIEFYENADHGLQRRAALFRTCIVGFERCKPTHIRTMKPGMPDLLEHAILKASDVLGDEDDSEEEAEAEDEEEEEEDYPDSIFAQHQQDAGKEKAEEFREEDMIYVLHRGYGYRYDEIYGLLVGEIDRLMEGAERADEREDDVDVDVDSVDTNADSANMRGSRGDRASQLGWR